MSTSCSWWWRRSCSRLAGARAAGTPFPLKARRLVNCHFTLFGDRYNDHAYHRLARCVPTRRVHRGYLGSRSWFVAVGAGPVERRERVVDGSLQVVIGAGCWSSLRRARRIEDRIAAAAGDFEDGQGGRRDDGNPPSRGSAGSRGSRAPCAHAGDVGRQTGVDVFAVLEAVVDRLGDDLGRGRGRRRRRRTAGRRACRTSKAAYHAGGAGKTGRRRPVDLGRLRGEGARP